MLVRSACRVALVGLASLCFSSLAFSKDKGDGDDMALNATWTPNVYLELRADFQHLRRWRKSVEQAQSYTFKAVITIIVTGVVGAVWLGIKVMLGK
jgi:hypothetical protein